MNVHLRSTHNRNVLYGLVDLLEIDILVISETWFDEKTSGSIMGKSLGDRFLWYGRERSGQISKSGSGGVGIIVRKNIGDVSLVKSSSDQSSLCLHFFVAAVYLPPVNSHWNDDFVGSITELQSDCLDFRKLGKVIVMGDFNCRIFNLPSIIHHHDLRLEFSRNTCDVDKNCSSILSRGKKFIQAMNAANMVIMNGLEQKSNVTFKSDSIGESIVDYIILSDTLLFNEAGNDHYTSLSPHIPEQGVLIVASTFRTLSRLLTATTYWVIIS